MATVLPFSTDYAVLRDLLRDIRLAMKKDEGRITDRVYSIRGRVVILDADVAALYGVSVARLRDRVRKNRIRFPEDFMIQLTAAETNSLGCKEQSGSGRDRNGRRRAPWAFTALGVLALSSVLRGERAVRASVAMMREVASAGIVPFFGAKPASVTNRPSEV